MSCTRVLLAAMVAMAGCPRDAFECGVDVGGKIHVCDGVGEVCVCGTHRCARPTSAPECSASQLAYVFGDDCVEAVDVASALDQSRRQGEAALCVDERRARSCGGAIDQACAANEVCVCDEQACARPDPACAASGLRFVDRDRCVETPRAELPRHLPDASGLCPGHGAVACGLPALGGGQACAAGQRCHCPSHRCFEPAPYCPTSGHAWSEEGRPCVETTTTALSCFSVAADAACPTALDAPVSDRCAKEPR